MQRASNQVGAFQHAEQADATARLACWLKQRAVKAATVVFHARGNLVLAAQIQVDLDIRGLGILNDIGDRFLQNSVQRRFDARWQPTPFAAHLQIDANACFLKPVLCLPADGSR